MKPYYEHAGITLYHGDCREAMAALPDASIDAVVTDPPYGLSFMGKRWDYDVPSVEIWQQVLRVLKPGGHLLAFAGTRTQHRMAVRIEDAGFEIRDMIAWVYGSGFPKSHNLKDEWQGWGTALKPALEPITVARKPLCGTVAANVLRYGTGGINVDGCRVGTEPAYTDRPRGPHSPLISQLNGHGTVSSGGNGRWPANLIHDGSDEVVGLFPETDGVVGARREGGDKSIFSGGGHKQTNKQSIVGGSKDTGSAARFFYTAKADKSDRGAGNNHPTVKPVDLMRYLVRLVCPMGGIVLDPFNGSGTTAVASRAEHCKYIGAELNEDYCRITVERLAQGVLF